MEENITTNNSTYPGFGSLVSDEIHNVFQIVTYVALSEAISVFGVGTNIINLIVFYKIGFRETVNISLFALAISDFMSCLTGVWFNLCKNPLFQRLDLPFYVDEIYYTTGGWPHSAFAKVTIVTTAFITLERCLCVTFPLKIKLVLNPRKATAILVCIYIVVLGAFAPAFYIYQLDWKFFPELNKTRLGLVFAPDRLELENVFFLSRDITLPLFMFIFITVCTAILVMSLKKKREWRNKATTSTKTSTMSLRDTKVARMVITVSALFIVCYFPVVLTTIPQIIFPEFNVGKRYYRLLDIVYSFNFMLAFINGSANVFIYYFRSSNYREMFDHVFLKKRKV